MRTVVVETSNYNEGAQIKEYARIMKSPSREHQYQKKYVIFYFYATIHTYLLNTCSNSFMLAIAHYAKPGSN